MQKQVYKVYKTGSIKNLNLTTEELSKPSENEITVKVEAYNL